MIYEKLRAAKQALQPAQRHIKIINNEKKQSDARPDQERCHQNADGKVESKGRRFRNHQTAY